jgi:hypothetical protein
MLNNVRSRNDGHVSWTYYLGQLIDVRGKTEESACKRLNFILDLYGIPSPNPDLGTEKPSGRGPKNRFLNVKKWKKIFNKLEKGQDKPTKDEALTFAELIEFQGINEIIQCPLCKKSHPNLHRFCTVLNQS